MENNKKTQSNICEKVTPESLIRIPLCCGIDVTGRGPRHDARGGGMHRQALQRRGEERRGEERRGSIRERAGVGDWGSGEVKSGSSEKQSTWA